MQRRSSNTVEVKLFRLNYEEVMERLKEYANKAVIEEGAKAVILVGSLARGDYTAFSDADVIIVSDNVASRPIDRITRFLDPTLPIDLQPRVYTAKEFIEMARRKAKTVVEALTHGVLLAGSQDIIEEAKKALNSHHRKSRSTH